MHNDAYLCKYPVHLFNSKYLNFSVRTLEPVTPSYEPDLFKMH